MKQQSHFSRHYAVLLTVISLAKRHHAIFTVGYVPYFRAYPGMRIPNPVEIVEHHGDSPTEQICSEVMALTKLNWNSYSFGSSDPITISSLARWAVSLQSFLRE